MEIITGRTGQPHVYALDDAEIYKLFLGDGDFCLQTGNRFAKSRPSPTTVVISDGSCIMQGRLCKIRTGLSDTLTLDNGTVGYKRVDIIAVEYTQTVTERQVEQGGEVVTVRDVIDDASLVVVKGTPNTSQYVLPDLMSGSGRATNGDIDKGETHRMPLYYIKLDGINTGDEPDDDMRTFLNTSPISTALSVANSAVSQIQTQMANLQTSIYQYADDLRQGISSGFKGCWKTTKSVFFDGTVTIETFDMGASYSYSPDDIIEVYFNGLRLASFEYFLGETPVGGQNIRIGFTHTSFHGDIEVVAFKLSEE